MGHIDPQCLRMDIGAPHLRPAIQIRQGLKKDSIRATHKQVDFDCILADLWEKHVYGHRDDHIGPLSVEEFLNCRMDLKAKELAIDIIHYPRRHFPQPITLGLGAVRLDGTLLKSSIRSPLYDMVLYKAFIRRLGDNCQIDSHLLGSAVHCVRSFVTKWIADEIPTGAVLMRQPYRLLLRCPICSSEDENLLNGLTCKAPSASTYHESLLAEPKTFMTPIKTHPRYSKLSSHRTLFMVS